jgi:hypothetical protein
MKTRRSIVIKSKARCFETFPMATEGQGYGGESFTHGNANSEGENQIPAPV